MDNVVQNIRLEDIIPSNFQNNNSKQIQELASSIEKYGIIDELKRKNLYTNTIGVNRG